MVHGDHGIVRACIMLITSRCVVAPIIIEGAKHPRFEEREGEKSNNLKYIHTILEHKLINTGENLLKIPHPRAHAPQSLSILRPISLLWQARGLETVGMQSHKLDLQLGQGQGLSGWGSAPPQRYFCIL